MCAVLGSPRGGMRSNKRNEAAASHPTIALRSSLSPYPIVILGLSHFKVQMCSKLSQFVNICVVSAVWKASLVKRWTELVSMSSCKLVTTAGGQPKASAPQVAIVSCEKKGKHSLG